MRADVDKTGDVQTAALVASFVHPGRLSNARAERWVASYRKLLDAWQLYIHRARFDVARGSRTRFAQQALRDAGADVEPIDLAPARVLLRCHCASNRRACRLTVSVCGTVAAPTPGGATPNLPTGPPALRHRPTACAQCKKSFPRCSICLTAIAVLPELDTLERPTSYTWCQCVHCTDRRRLTRSQEVSARRPRGPSARLVPTQLDLSRRNLRLRLPGLDHRHCTMCNIPCSSAGRGRCEGCEIATETCQRGGPQLRRTD